MVEEYIVKQLFTIVTLSSIQYVSSDYRFFNINKTLLISKRRNQTQFYLSRVTFNCNSIVVIYDNDLCGLNNSLKLQDHL